MNRIAILTSLAGFGTYVPSVLLYNGLKEQGYLVDIYVYEDFFDEDQKLAFNEFREKFHKDIRFAQAAMRISNSFKNNAIKSSEIYQMWSNLKTNVFFIFSGKWVKTVRFYNCESKIVENFQIDYADSPSWKDIKETDKTQCLLGESGNPPLIRLRSQKPKCKKTFKSGLIHGGGWGIETQITLPEEIVDKYQINIILQENEDNSKHNSEFNIFFNYKDSYYDKRGNYCIPQVKRFTSNSKADVIDIQSLLTKTDFIISKPGGGTCLDCLNFGIPLIFLEPIAKHEQNNSDYFVKYGLGVYFTDWINNKNRDDLLKKISENICAYMDKTKPFNTYVNEVLK